MHRFPGQREDEKVLAVIRKHFIVYVHILLLFGVMFLLPLAAFLFIWFAVYPLTEHFKGGAIVGIFSSVFLLYGLLYVMIRWIDEEFDVFIVTNDRLIDVSQISFFKRSVASTPLEQIQDTTGMIDGFFGTLFQYGSLTVQTAAGDASDFSIDHIPDPEGEARRILNWAHKKRAGQTVTDNES